MRKRFLITLVVCFVAILAVSIYLFFSPNSPIINNVNLNPDQSNETQNSWRFPNITFPWSPGKSSGGAGSGGSGSESGSSGSGSGDGDKTSVIKNNYTLFINSTHNLNVSVTYTANDVVTKEVKSLPFSLNAQEGTYTCLAETTGSGTIRWLLEDETECAFSDCEGGLYNCNILMSENRSITLRQYS
ncbi:hypothetical protein A3K64_02100 [Candidatus Micrarchaeota archaeon RBG_16_36_9]|nr:MAG: hypothetical protein A3K64_02100 [Candidatus Micrarchaeota archaeon RBG_16_36_9]